MQQTTTLSPVTPTPFTLKDFKAGLRKMSRWDWSIIVGAAVLAVTITTIAVRIFGAEIFSLAAGVSSLLVLAACKWVQHNF